MPVLVRARHTTHLQPKAQPYLVAADLGSPALKAEACHQTLAALALICINDDDAVSRPPSGDGAVHHSLLPGRGLHVLDDVRGMGLAPIPHRQAPQMSIGERRGNPSHPSRWQSWLSHRAPPADEAGCAGR